MPEGCDTHHLSLSLSLSPRLSRVYTAAAHLIARAFGQLTEQTLWVNICQNVC